MASNPAPMDEMVWRSPADLQGMSLLHSNSVLHYFARSPFFDPTSNNGIIASQGLVNPAMAHFTWTREAFEGRLKTMSGLEFMVVQEPAETNPMCGTGVWIIRKQTRRKRQGEEDEITPHATYFIVGSEIQNQANIYMAPTVADIISSRMLSITSSLDKFLSKASTLPKFTSSAGNSYLPSHSTKKISESQLTQTSKENTPMPDTLSTKKPLSSTSSSTYLDNKLLEETLNISLKYGDEYMDENPITGQPGDFHLSTKGRHDPAKLAVPVAKAPLPSTSKPSATATPTSPSLSALKTDIPPAKKGSKSERSPKTPGSGVPKPKRRKSKAPGSTPMSATPS